MIEIKLLIVRNGVVTVSLKVTKENISVKGIRFSSSLLVFRNKSLELLFVASLIQWWMLIMSF